MKLPIYLDHHATTPVDRRVVEAMMPYFSSHFGNAASRHHEFGWKARDAVEAARQQIADLIGANVREIVFTSGATESDNLAIKGVAGTHRHKGDHIITVVTEHRAVLDVCKRLESEGWRITYLPVDPDGLVDLDRLTSAITGKTILISIMTANNEIGVVQPIASIGSIAREKSILFHTDAVQAVGKIPFAVNDLHVDLVSLSAHRMYGPKGVGALYVRRRNPHVSLSPLMDGGGHERGLRSGTLNVAGIVGFGKAAELCGREMPAECEQLHRLRNRLNDLLHERLTDIYVNGSMAHRLPHNLNVSFAGVSGEALLMGMDDVAVSSGSACTSAGIEPPYVLKALGVSDDLARASIRFGLGRSTTEEEVDYAAAKVASVVSRLREMLQLQDLAEEGFGPAEDEWRLD